MVAKNETGNFLPRQEIANGELEKLHLTAAQFAYATEQGAMAAARTAGRGDGTQSDHEAVEAMRAFLNTLEINGRIVIGEGERDKAPMLYIGETVGTGNDTEIDIAVDPLENTNATAENGPRAISVLAVSEKNGLFHAPDMYMDKLVVGPKTKGQVSLDASVEQNVGVIAESLNRNVSDLVIVVLKRERHNQLIHNIRTTGARAKLIPDGDLMPGIAACLRGTGVHALMGIGAAPEGVMTAAAVRCLGGEMQTRFWPVNDQEIDRLHQMGGELDKIYTESDLASGNMLIFSATGVTDGDVLKGVRFFGGGARTHNLTLSWFSKGYLTMDFTDRTHIFNKNTPLRVR